MNSIFKTARGVIAGLFMAHGFWRGMSWPVVAGTVAMFILHHWPEIVGAFKTLRSDVQAQDAPGLARDLAEMKDKVNVLTLAATFRKPTPAQPAQP